MNNAPLQPLGMPEHLRGVTFNALMRGISTGPGPAQENFGTASLT